MLCRWRVADVPLSGEKLRDSAALDESPAERTGVAPGSENELICRSCLRLVDALRSLSMCMVAVST